MDYVVGVSEHGTYVRVLVQTEVTLSLAIASARDAVTLDVQHGLKRLLVDLSATGGFKVPVLTDLLYASADYTLRVQRDGYMTGATMLDQVVMARASLQLF